MSDRGRLEEVERHVIQEFIVERMIAGLPQDLLQHLDACGTTTVDQMRQCIRNYQLQHSVKEEGQRRLYQAVSYHG